MTDVVVVYDGADVQVVEFGFPGPRGATGAAGAQGIPGSSSNLFGATLPDAALFADGATYALVAGSVTTLYERQAGAWVQIGEPKGTVALEAALRATADALLIPLTQRGTANGVATLDGAGTIPDAQIPAGIARDTEVSAAVAALVASAPSTLDTLNELAAALGNDPNFATTLTTTLAGKAPNLTRTAVKTANYTAAANELVPVDTTAGSVTITLPTAPTTRSRIAVKHIIVGGSNTVTVACAGSDVFNKAGGATTLTLSLLAQAVLLDYDLATHIWTVLADDLPLSVLDARFSPFSEAATRATADTTNLATATGRALAFALVLGG